MPERFKQYTSVSSAVAFDPPIAWVQIVGAGSTVLADATGTAVTITTDAAEPGFVAFGPFSAFTSTTATRVRMGDASTAPPVVFPVTGAAAGVSVAAISGLTATNAQTAFAEIVASETATKGVIRLGPTDFALLTGAPLALFVDGASAVPGLAMVESECFAIRWNNNGTLDGVVGSYDVPPDADITADFTVHVRCAKIGATVGDAVTFAVGAYNQVVGATYIADSNYGGNTGAMTGDAATKTIQNVTRTLALADLAAYPASVTLTLKPTDGTLGTDDLLVLEVFVLYKKKLVS